MRRSIFPSVCLVVSSLVLAGALPAFAQQPADPPAPPVTTPAPVLTFSRAASGPSFVPPRGSSEIALEVLVFTGLLFEGGKTAFVVGGGAEKPMERPLIGSATTAIAAEVSFSRAGVGIGGSSKTLSVLGGLAIGPEQAKKDAMKIKPFGRILAGFAHNSFSGFDGATGFALQFGGGFNYEIKPGMMVRVMADIPIVFFEGGAENGFRLTGGLSIPLPRK